ncbi:MAG: hypothetical protein AB1630_09045 [bacterium]
MNELIKILSYGIPIEKHPFKRIAKELGISEKEVIEKIKNLKDEGIIRFFRASIDYRKIGYSVNVLLCFLVTDNKIDNIAKDLSKYKMVSHCYRRLPVEKFPYNLFLMLHSKTKDEILSCIEKIKRDFSLNNPLLLFTKREFKRQRPRIKETSYGD